MDTLKVARPVKGYFPMILTKQPEAFTVSTAGQIDEEIWTALEYYSAVEAVGKKFLAEKGVPKRDVDATYKLFKAYVKQSKSYYTSAKALHYRSSSLLYYYCFLNLAKAGLLIRQPQLGKKKLQHGLSYQVGRKFRSFTDVVVQVEKGHNQVFDLLYQAYFNEPNEFETVNIIRLLSYVSDVTSEYEQCGYGQSRLLPGLFTAASDGDIKQSWGLVGLYGSAAQSYPGRYANFFKSYEPTDLSKRASREIWGLNGTVHAQYTFFQSIKPHAWLSDNTPYPPYTMARDTVDAFKNTVQTNYYSNDPSFYLTLPYAKTKQCPMDEMLAIYTVMFYLGSLVRYRPDYLEELLDTKESWLLSSFIRVAPLAFLRGFSSWILGKDYKYVSR